jgi:hypothetical protein
MTSDIQGTQGQSSGENTSAESNTLRFELPDPKTAAAELTRRTEEIKKSIAAVERAKVVTHQLLRREVSI